MSATHTDVLLAGGLAAFAVDLLVFPLDTLKTRFQSPDYKRLYYDASQKSLNRKALFRGLYQGVGPIILITIPSCELRAFFTAYEGAKTILSKANPTLSGSTSPLIPQPLVHSAASATAELVSCLLLTPAEVLKQNAQMMQRPKDSKGSKTRTSVTLEVWRNIKTPSQLFRGYTALAARNLPFTAMQFPMFEILKDNLKGYRKKTGAFTGGHAETAVITAFSAGSAGSVAAVITTPFDVVKTRIMLSASTESAEESAKKKIEKSQRHGNSTEKLMSGKGAGTKSSLAVAREVFRENGVKGLFRGGSLRAAWTALGSGLYLGVYETGKGFLEERREHQDTVI